MESRVSIKVIKVKDYTFEFYINLSRYKYIGDYLNIYTMS